MADYLIHDSTLEDIADAIRAKTGGSSLIEPEDMPTEIASIETGGGGSSLPSSISKIDGGTFTFATNQVAGDYNIPHNLGVIPKGFSIWTEDEISGTSSVRLIGNCTVIALNIIDRNSNNIVSAGEATILYNGSYSSTSNNQFTSATTPNLMNATRIRWYNTLMYYKADATYKWIAWA